MSWTAIAGVEWRVVQWITSCIRDAVLKETLLVGDHSIADVLLDVRSRALELGKCVELRSRYRVPHPSQELLIGDEPDVGHRRVGRSPVEEVVEHIDHVDRAGDTWVVGEVNRMGVHSKWQVVRTVVIEECILHPPLDVFRSVIEPRVHTGGGRRRRR